MLNLTIGNIITFSVFFLYIILNGEALDILIEPASIVLLCLPFIIYSLYKGKLLMTIDINIYKPDDDVNKLEVENTLLFLKKSIIFLGCIGAFVGFIFFLNNFQNISAIGPGISFTITSILYSATLLLVFVNPLFIQSKIHNLGNYDIRLFPFKNIIILAATIVTILLIVFSFIISGGQYAEIFNFSDFLTLFVLATGSIISGKILKALILGYKIQFVQNNYQQDSFKNDIMKILEAYHYLIFNIICSGIILAILKVIVLMVKLDKPMTLGKIISISSSPIIISIIMVFFVWVIKVKLNHIYQMITNKNYYA